MGVAPLLRAIKNGVPDGSSKEVGLTNAVVREAQPAAVGVLCEVMFHKAKGLPIFLFL
jgi:hypothetical protein